jgi:hypothetical protein
MVLAEYNENMVSEVYVSIWMTTVYLAQRDLLLGYNLWNLFCTIARETCWSTEPEPSPELSCAAYCCCSF